MRLASESMSLRKTWFGLPVAGAILVLIGSTAHAQNLDQGKSPAKLFADSCAACHHTPRGLAKGRFRLTLFLFLQKHYASDSGAAWQLTSYLESLEGPRRGRSKTAAANLPSSATSASRSSLRPPMPVPQR